MHSSILYLLCIPMLGVSSRTIPVWHHGGATQIASTTASEPSSSLSPSTTSSSLSSDETKTPHGCGGLGRISCNKRTSLPVIRPSPTQIAHPPTITIQLPITRDTNAPTSTSIGTLSPTESYQGCGGLGRISCNRRRGLSDGDTDADTTALPTVTITFTDIPIPTRSVITQAPVKGTVTASGPYLSLPFTSVGFHGCGGLGRLSCNKRTVYAEPQLSSATTTSTTSTATVTRIPPPGCGGLGRISCNKRDAHPHYPLPITTSPPPPPPPAPTLLTSTTTSTSFSISFHVPGCGGLGRISCNKRSPAAWHVTPTTSVTTTPTTTPIATTSTTPTFTYITPTSTATRNLPPPPGCGGLGRLSCNGGGDDDDIFHHSSPSYSIVPIPTNA